MQKLRSLLPIANGHDDVTQRPEFGQFQVLAVGHFRHGFEELAGLVTFVHLNTVNSHTLKETEDPIALRVSGEYLKWGRKLMKLIGQKERKKGRKGGRRAGRKEAREKGRKEG